MALNMNDKKSLLGKMVPEIDISVSTNGLTLRSKRFNTPRFVPYEATGKCKECRSDTVELDFVVSQDGVTLFCSRIKGEKFVKFDKTNELPGFCFFKLRSRGRVFNLVHGNPEDGQSTIKEYMHHHHQTNEFTVKEEEIIDLTESGPPSPVKPNPPKSESIDEIIGAQEVDSSLNVQRFFDSLSAATKFLDLPPVRSTMSSGSSSSSLGTDVNAEGNAIIRMGKMPWEEEEEESATHLSKKPKVVADDLIA